MTTPIVHIKMLGEFSISINGKTIDDQGSHSKRPWSFLEYLIAHRKRKVTADELSGIIWENTKSNDPRNALKTLLFRARKLLAPLDYPAHELIIQRGVCFAWNPDVNTVVDADLFEEYCKTAAKPNLTKRERLEYYLLALQLYKGDFLPKSEWESWVVPISTYYHTLYQQAVYKTVDLLSFNDRWGDVIELCQKAISLDPFDEQFHYSLIYALYKGGDPHRALDQFAHVTSLFYNEFAITPSSRLRDLYKVIRDEKHGVTIDLDTIQESLQEEAPVQGAFYCEYVVFRAIYQLERRALTRTGDTIYLCLVTINDPSGEMPKSSVMTKAMMVLGESIMSSLRRGDTYTRYSVSQYMILLPSATYENGELVLKRISANFYQNYTRKSLNLQYSLQAVLPQHMEEQ